MIVCPVHPDIAVKMRLWFRSPAIQKNICIFRLYLTTSCLLRVLIWFYQCRISRLSEDVSQGASRTKVKEVLLMSYLPLISLYCKLFNPQNLQCEWVASHPYNQWPCALPMLACVLLVRIWPQILVKGPSFIHWYLSHI